MIRIEHFTKVYDGKPAVRDLSLHIEKGDIFGFIGPNGAGKTTTLRFLATLHNATSGRAFISGFDVEREPDKVKRHMGFMPDYFGVYDGMRVWEFLDFFAVAYGISLAKRRSIIGDILELLDLTRKRDELVNNLSRGMRQRLGVAKTLVHDPPVLILDEPASGMDPRARIEIRELLKELRSMGKTILISSHILSELSECCNKIGIMERGVLCACGSLEEILQEVRKQPVIEIKVAEGVENAAALLGKHPKVVNLQVAGNAIKFAFTGGETEIADLHTSLVRHGVKLLWFKEETVRLEEVFLAVTKGEVA